MVRALFENRSPQVATGQWAGIFLLTATLLGVSLMMVPAHWVLILMVSLAAVAWLALNPDKLFYLVIFTIPFAERIRVLPFSFSVNDLMILFCVGVAVLDRLMRDRQSVSLRTPLDGWLAMLVGVFFLAGMFSEAGNGLQAFLKFFEAVMIFYLVVYFVRTRQVTRAQILKALLWTAVFQAALGIFQSWTGVGADFSSTRGYLGYLGLGSSVVWHGKGTTYHFNMLGNYLVTNLLVLMPVFLFCVRDKRKALLWCGIILLGILTTYSRGSLLGLAAGVIYFLVVSQRNLLKSLGWVTAFVVLCLLPLAWLMLNTSYVETISFDDRLRIWQVPIAAITSSDKAFWLGSGLNAYNVVAWAYLPAYVMPQDYDNWFAHNFYLLTALEMGILGAIAFFGFMGYLWWDGLLKARRGHGWQAAYGMAISVSMVSIFFVSIFDHTLATPYAKILLFLLLGLLYVQGTGTAPSSSVHRRPEKD